MNYLTSGPKKSIRKAASKVGSISRSTVQRIRKSSVDKDGNHCVWQAVERCQLMSQTTKEKRVRYCVIELMRLFRTTKLPEPTNPDLWVSPLVRAVADESGNIPLVPSPNIHNSGTYCIRGKTPAEFLRQGQQKYPKSITIFAVVTCFGVWHINTKEYIARKEHLVFHKIKKGRPPNLGRHRNPRKNRKYTVNAEIYARLLTNFAAWDKRNWTTKPQVSWLNQHRPTKSNLNLEAGSDF